MIIQSINIIRTIPKTQGNSRSSEGFYTSSMIEYRQIGVGKYGWVVAGGLGGWLSCQTWSSGHFDSDRNQHSNDNSRKIGATEPGQVVAPVMEAWLPMVVLLAG